MSDLDEKKSVGNKPRVTLPKVGGLGGPPKPPSAPSEKEKIASANEEPDIEKFSFFHWNPDTEESKKGNDE